MRKNGTLSFLKEKSVDLTGFAGSRPSQSTPVCINVAGAARACFYRAFGKTEKIPANRRPDRGVCWHENCERKPGRGRKGEEHPGGKGGDKATGR